MSRLARYRAVIAATALSMPYYPPHQMLMFYVLPLTPIEWLLGWVPITGKFHLGWVMPLATLMLNALPWVFTTVKNNGIAALFERVV